MNHKTNLRPAAVHLKAGNTELLIKILAAGRYVLAWYLKGNKVGAKQVSRGWVFQRQGATTKHALSLVDTHLDLQLQLREFWEIGRHSLRRARSSAGIWCYTVYLLKLQFSSAELISVVWRPVIILGELQLPSGGWQPYNLTKLEAQKAGLVRQILTSRLDNTGEDFRPKPFRFLNVRKNKNCTQK